MILLLKIRKYYRKLFITFAFITITLLINNPLIYSQETKGCPAGVIFEEEEPILYVYNKVNYNTCLDRAEIIKDRLENIAKETSIKVNDIKVEEWEYTTNITHGSGTIITLTKADIIKAKVPLNDKNKLANEYKQKIKKAIERYRNKRETEQGVPPTEEDVPPTEDDVPPTEDDVPPTEDDVSFFDYKEFIKDSLFILYIFTIIFSCINFIRIVWSIIINYIMSLEL